MVLGGLFKSLYENQVLVVAALLKQLKVKATLHTINETLHAHPNYPSFLSISDSLQKWKVENLAIQTNVEILDEIPTPFITTFKNGIFITVKKLTDDRLIIINQHGKEETISKAVFLENWTQTILVAESNEYSGEQGYQQKLNHSILQASFYAFIPLSLLIAILLPFAYGSVALIPTLYTLAKLIGLGVSVLLLWYDIDKGNPLLKQICSGIQKANCSAVLNTKAATIAGLITWSEVGFVYFAGSLLLVAFAGINAVIPLLSLFSLLALPYIIFSVYYQWKVAKQWCVLCLMVQVVLLVEGLLVAANGFIAIPAIKTSVSSTYFLAILAITIPITLWFLLKPILKRLQSAKYEKRSYLQLKFNDEVFWSLLKKQSSVLEYPSEGLGITIGNPNAKHTIIKVCNPYCGPCATAHPELEKMVEHNSNVNARIIFTVTSNEEDFRARPVRHLLAIAAKGEAELTKHALDDWYLAKKKDYDLFAAKYSMNGELMEQTEKITKMMQWCDKANIQYTPTIFLDGYEIPKTYQIKDVNYFLT
ncbi:MAG: hypothetical protein EAZ35_09210 [Sphingobacteriia bacterium]|nr:MAG: hypothetical protein EAZ41_04060 [Sphingobacteriia bacterium]TAG29929.1 MAG: hypothetical protein EAZ35_09210 [Sphingobacteriia bacterium]